MTTPAHSASPRSHPDRPLHVATLRSPKEKDTATQSRQEHPPPPRMRLSVGFGNTLVFLRVPFGGIHPIETGGSQEELLPKTPALRSWTPTAQKGTDGRPCVGRNVPGQSSALPAPDILPGRPPTPPVTPPNRNPDTEALPCPSRLSTRPYTQPHPASSLCGGGAWSSEEGTHAWAPKPASDAAAPAMQRPIAGPGLPCWDVRGHRRYPHSPLW